MSPGQRHPEISLIIPFLNERDSLFNLLESLVHQTGLVFEVIFSDGGSSDGSAELLEDYLRRGTLDGLIVQSHRGRGRQMNDGCRHARAENILFLHADTLLPDCLTLRKAVDALNDQLRKTGHERVAGHFPICFDRSVSERSMTYGFYECKTRLNRQGCINGDQGFLMRRLFFDELGGFDESLGFLEDERLARKIFEKGTWFLLPGRIRTSARRFEAEGLFERQILNALIMNFSVIGWTVFFHEAAGIYTLQKDSGRLKLLPFFKKINELLRLETLSKRISLWYYTGVYVNENAWQLAFVLDVRRHFIKSGPADESMATPCLEAFDSRWRFFIHNPCGCFITALLTWLWFHSYRLWMMAGSAFSNFLLL